MKLKNFDILDQHMYFSPKLILMVNATYIFSSFVVPNRIYRKANDCFGITEHERKEKCDSQKVKE